MNSLTLIASYLSSAVVAGVFGGGAMIGAMWLMTEKGIARGNMIVALGGLVTKSRNNAFRVGLILHIISAIGFAMVYSMLMMWIGATALPQALYVGIGVGILHGLLVSLMLVWVVADEHPFEEYTDAGLAVGLTHLLGHVVYGAVVGLVIGISPL